MESILARFPADNFNRFWATYASGDVEYDADSQFPDKGRVPVEMLERRIGMLCDLRRPVPQQVLDAALERAARDKTPLLEGQVRRAQALAAQDPAEMTRAVEVFERLGAVPQLGRSRAERGLLLHDAAETEAGLAILKRLGDTNYLDRFATRVV